MEKGKKDIDKFVKKFNKPTRQEKRRLNRETGIKNTNEVTELKKIIEVQKGKIVQLMRENNSLRNEIAQLKKEWAKILDNIEKEITPKSGIIGIDGKPIK